MCSKCCIRVQRKTAEYNRANPTKPRVVLKHWIDFRERSNARVTRSLWSPLKMESKVKQQHEKRSTKMSSRSKMKSKRTLETKSKSKPKPKPKTKPKPKRVMKWRTKPKPKPKPKPPLKTKRSVSHTPLPNPSVQSKPPRELVTKRVFLANSTTTPSNPRFYSLESGRMNCAEGMSGTKLPSRMEVGKPAGKKWRRTGAVCGFETWSFLERCLTHRGETIGAFLSSEERWEHLSLMRMWASIFEMRVSIV